MKYNIKKIIIIQSLFRGFACRLSRLPNILYSIRLYLQQCKIQISNTNKDGRINSCIDEENIIELLLEKFDKRIKQTKIRMWYDIQIYDYRYGWIPINIKTSTLKTSDNIGNLALCVYSYTNENLSLVEAYSNGNMSKVLFHKIQNNEYNLDNKKDYYFLIIDKNNSSDIIINSVKGLSILTPNINNLPFQVCWSKNREYIHKPIKVVIKNFILCLQKPKDSWKTIFMTNIKTIKP